MSAFWFNSKPISKFKQEKQGYISSCYTYLIISYSICQPTCATHWSCWWGAGEQIPVVWSTPWTSDCMSDNQSASLLSIPCPGSQSTETVMNAALLHVTCTEAMKAENHHLKTQPWEYNAKCSCFHIERIPHDDALVCFYASVVNELNYTGVREKVAIEDAMLRSWTSTSSCSSSSSSCDLISQVKETQDFDLVSPCLLYVYLNVLQNESALYTIS